jgi:prepilin-type processing-associated H-X9-DG protein
MKQLGLGMIMYYSDYDETFPSGLNYWNGSYGSRPNDGSGWAEEIYPYVKSAGLFICPDDVTTQQVISNVAGDPRANIVSYGANSNVIGTPLPTPANTTPPGGGVNAAPVSPALPCPMVLAQLNSPDRTVLLYEMSDGFTFFGTIPNGMAAQSPYGFLAPGQGRGSVSGDGADNWPGNGTGSSQYCYATGYMGQPQIIPTDHGRSGPGIPTASPVLGRHQGGSIFLACDGHVKYEAPNQVSPGVNAVSPTSSQDTPVAGTFCTGLGNGYQNASFQTNTMVSAAGTNSTTPVRFGMTFSAM